MTRLRDQPLRLEPALTRDYVNRQAKMEEITRRLQQETRWHRWRDRAGWAVVVLLFGAIGLVWWFQ